MAAVDGFERRIRHTSVPLTTGRFKSRIIEIGRLLGDGAQRGVAAADDRRLNFTGSLEGVLDQAGNIVLVFDDQDPCDPAHARRARPSRRFRGRWLIDSRLHECKRGTKGRFPPGDARVNCG